VRMNARASQRRHSSLKGPRRVKPQVQEGGPTKNQPTMIVQPQFDWEQIKSDLGERRLTPADLIVLLLDAGKVSGKTMMQKQIFLAYKEVLPVNRTVDPGFRPDLFGPFSQVVADMLTALRLHGIVRVESRGEGHSTYFLGPNGRSAAKVIRTRPGVERFRAELGKRKVAWDEWSAHGIMRYVYRKYPEYATATAVPHLKWE
jgi:uncharacterized protein YwgA